MFTFLTLPKVCSQDIEQILLTESNPDTLFQIAEDLFKNNQEKMALKLVNKAQEEYNKLGQINGVLNMRLAKSSIHFRLGRYIEYKKQLIEIKKFENKQSEYNLETRADLYSILASYNKSLGNIDRAIFYYEKSIEIDKATGNIKNQISSCINLGQYSSLNNEISRAKKYYYSALHLTDLDLENEYREGQKASIQNALGNLYLNEKEYYKAIESYTMILDRQFSSHPLYSEHKIGALINRARAYLFLGQYIDMKRDLIIAQELIENSSLHQFTSKILEVRASASARQNNFEDAIDLYVKIDQLLIGLHGTDISNIEVMMNDLNLALTYQKLSKHDSAILYFEQVVNQITNHKTSEHTFENLEGIDKAPFSYLLLQALNGYAESHFDLYSQTQSSYHLKESYYAYNCAILSVSKIRTDYNDFNSKLNLSIKSNIIFEKAIETSLILYELENDDQYLVNAFRCSENNRASLLSEAINENRALKTGALPDTLLEEEKNLRLQISSTNKQLHEFRLLNEEKEVKLKELYLFDLQNELSRSKKKIEARYPTYFNIKYNLNDFDINLIQTTLKSQNTVLFEYFIGETKIYTFYLDGDKIKYKSQKLDAHFINAVEELIQFTSNPPQFSTLVIDFKSYIDNAHLLFSELISPFYKDTDKRLLIVPDGFLNFVPFETLITSLPKSNATDFSRKNVPYLLNDHDIRYHYSAQLNSSLESNTNQKTNTVNAFAPSFGSMKGKSVSTCSNRNYLQELNCNIEEVETIKVVIPSSQTFIDQAASLGSFLSNYKGSNILHIASHACIDPSDPHFNKIFLVDDYLSNNDIFNLDLDTDLVVLSACETGGGEYVKGEGVMSLAKGFLQAGSQSILMSLWQVDDCITANQMKSFYKNIAKNLTKSESLKIAKIQHFETSKKDKLHPYYWSPFVIIGSDDPIIFSQGSSSLILYSLAIFCAILVLIFFFKSK